MLNWRSIALDPGVIRYLESSLTVEVTMLRALGQNDLKQPLAAVTALFGA